jgi:hypothetical protein
MEIGVTEFVPGTQGHTGFQGPAQQRLRLEEIYYKLCFMIAPVQIHAGAYCLLISEFNTKRRRFGSLSTMPAVPDAGPGKKPNGLPRTIGQQEADTASVPGPGTRAHSSLHQPLAACTAKRAAESGARCQGCFGSFGSRVLFYR